MIVCPNCKKEMPDGARFCDVCGFRLEIANQEMPQPQPPQAPQPSYQQPMPPNGAVYGYPQQPRQPGQPQQPVQNAGYPQPPYQQQNGVPSGYPQQFQPDKKKSKKKGGKVIILLAAIIAAVCLIVFLLIRLLGGNHKSSEAGLTDYVLYMGEDKELMLTKDANKFDPWELDEHFISPEMNDYGDIQEVVTTGGREIARLYNVVGDELIYLTNIGDIGGDLYIRSLKKEDAEPIKIASEVVHYQITKGGTALYYLCGYDDDLLYEYTLKTDTKEKIMSDCWGFVCSEDGSVIAFSNYDGTLYVKSAGEDKVKVESDVGQICHLSEDGSYVVYIKEDTLYSKNIKKDERTKIDVDVDRFVGVDSDDNFYYLKTDEKFVSYGEIIKDDMAAKEDSLVEPEYPAYPNSADYTTDEAWDKALEEYDKAYEEYDKAYDLYWGRWDRDALREKIADREQGIDYTSYSLYRYDGTDEEKVAGEVYPYDFIWNEDHSRLSFVSYPSLDEWKIDMSELEDLYSPRWEILDKRDDSAMICILAPDGVKEVGEWRACTNAQWLGSEYLYYASDYITEDEYGYENWSSTGNIYRYSLEKGESELIVDEACIHFTLFNNKLFYLKDYKDGKGDAYVDGECLDFEVSDEYFYVYEDMDMMLFFTDVDEERMIGTLKYYKNGEVTKVAEDVMYYNVAVTADGNIYYLTNYSTRHYRGDLYRYANGSSTKVDEEVTMIIEPVLNK